MNSKGKTLVHKFLKIKSFDKLFFLTQGSFLALSFYFYIQKHELFHIFPSYDFFFPLMFWARMGIITFYFLPISTFRFKNRFKRFLWRRARGPKGFRSRVFSTRQLSWSSTSCGRRKRQPPSTGTPTTSKGNKEF